MGLRFSVMRAKAQQLLTKFGRKKEKEVGVCPVENNNDEGVVEEPPFIDIKKRDEVLGMGNKPIWKVRCGVVQLAVWENEQKKSRWILFCC